MAPAQKTIFENNTAPSQSFGAVRQKLEIKGAQPNFEPETANGAKPVLIQSIILKGRTARNNTLHQKSKDQCFNLIENIRDQNFFKKKI